MKIFLLIHEQEHFKNLPLEDNLFKPIDQRLEEAKINYSEVKRKIIEYLRLKKHQVDDYTGIFEEGKLEGKDISAAELLYRINHADVFISEMSYPSQTLGFLFGYSILHGKPSLYMYNDALPARPGVPLFGNPSRLVTMKTYNNSTLEIILDQFISKAQQQLRSDRITFVSTVQINKYIDWSTKRTGFSKGEIIRSILEKALEEDEKYNASMEN